MPSKMSPLEWRLDEAICSGSSSSSSSRCKCRRQEEQEAAESEEKEGGREQTLCLADHSSTAASVLIDADRDDEEEEEEEAEEDGGYKAALEAPAITAAATAASAMHSTSLPSSTYTGVRRSSAPALTTNSVASSCDGPHVERVSIPLPDGLAVPAVLYAPASSTPSAIVIVSPGSNGGTGPGIEASKAGLPLKRCHSSAAYGSIYWRLGLDLSTGREHDWRGATVGPPSGKQVKANGLGNVAVLHISWRRTADGSRWPGKKLKAIASLRDACDDFEAATHWLLERFSGAPPIIFVGFSFGGPAAWAAAARLTEKGLPMRGVIALAGSGRGGSAFASEQLDTAGCIRRCTRAGVRALFLHGTEDQNVALDFASFSFQTASATCPEAKVALVIMDGATHMLDSVRGAAYALMKTWILSVVKEALQEQWQKRKLPKASPPLRRADECSLPNLVVARGRSSSLCDENIGCGVRGLKGVGGGGDGSYSSGFVAGNSTKRRISTWEASATWLPSSSSAPASAGVLVSGSTSSTIRSTPWEVGKITADALLEQGAKGYSEKYLSDAAANGGA